MRLRAEVIPYSSVVGGGVTLVNESGAVVGQLALHAFTGSQNLDDPINDETSATYKREYVDCVERIAHAINAGWSEREITHLKRGASYDVLGAASFQVSDVSREGATTQEALARMKEKARTVFDGDEVTVYARREPVPPGEPRLFVRFPDEVNDPARFSDAAP